MFKLMTAIVLAGFIALSTVNAQDSNPDKEPATPAEVAPAAKGVDVFAPKFKRLKGEMTLDWKVEASSKVEKGAVIAEIVIDGASRQVAAAERNVKTNGLQLAGLKESDRASSVSAQRELTNAERNLARAKEDFEYYKTNGKVWRIRQSEINLESRENSVTDQQDEMKQLRKLYEGNELGQESADIVLRRAERRLKVSKENQEQAKKSHERLKTVIIPRQLEDYKYGVAKAEDALTSAKFRAENGNLDLKVKIISAEARLEEAKRAVTEIKQDLELIVIKAPSAGTINFEVKKDEAVKVSQKVAVITE